MTKMYERCYAKMNKVLDLPVSVGDWVLEAFTLSEREVNLAKMRASWNTDRPLSYLDRFLKADQEYVRLRKGQEIWMSDTLLEIHTNRPFLRHAHGHVFIAGLGFGSEIKCDSSTGNNVLLTPLPR